MMRTVFFSLLCLLFCAGAFGQELTLDEIAVECPPSPTCEARKTRLANLQGSYRSIVHLKDTLKIMASDGGYESFAYELVRENDVNRLKIRFKLKPTIQEISIGFTDRNLEVDPSTLLRTQEGEYFEIQKLREDLAQMQKRIESMGYPRSSHVFEVIEKDELITINIAVTLAQPRIFKKIKTNTTSTYVHEFLVKKFYNLYNKPFDFTKFKLYLDDAQRELFSYGYYLLVLDFTPEVKGNRVVLDIKVTNDLLFAFDFKGIKQESRDALLAIVTDLFRKYKRALNETTLKHAIEEHYKKLAHLNVSIDVMTSTFKNKFKETVHLYRIFVSEKFKTRLKTVIFTGNLHFKQKKLKQMFDKEAFELASIRYYDDEYFDYFREFLKEKYLRSGYVQVQVQGPIKTMDTEKKATTVEYVIKEGRRAYVRNITFAGLPEDFEEKVTAAMVNKSGKPFNPILFDEDIKKIANLLQNNGHYFAEITNASDDSLVTYSKTGSEVDIHFIVNPGPLVRLHRVLYLGNNKTKKKVLYKKIRMKEGDLITPTKTREIESALSATGLFNSVSVRPVKHASKSATTDMLVKVTERETALIEVAPGYRTDLGIKLSGTASYLNLWGINHSITTRVQVNQRLNYQSFDAIRQDNSVPLLEHNVSMLYNASDIFDTQINMALGGTEQRKRFYSFDADIWRANATLTRDLSKRFSTSLRYQYEDITQFNASNEIDNDSFQIGGITPSITYDLRNSQVIPTSGAFFNLSTEWANPYFFSQKTEDLTINYYKLISRNRFYLPYKNGTLAISVVGGIQENLAKEKKEIDGVTQTEGFIPSIKVFRLTGMDIVRGFSDQEINTAADGTDISTVRVDKRAYLANLKVEPRFFLSDNLMAGVFYDAGRVFINEADLSELRDSVGVTFKIITPVGTLDFDYGFKLERKKLINRDGSTTLEDPGRFHVSIGFF